MGEYTSERMTFKLHDDGKWWAIDEYGVEYCIYKLEYFDYDSSPWCAMAQRRVAFNSVSTGIGTYTDFEEAASACDKFDAQELVENFR